MRLAAPRPIVAQKAIPWDVREPLFRAGPTENLGGNLLQLKLVILCALLGGSTIGAYAQSAGEGQQTTGAAIEARLPNGRMVTPQGKWIPLAPYPFALALRPDGGQIAVPAIGFPFSLNIIDGVDRETPEVSRYPHARKNDPDVQVHTGVDYSPDGSVLYDATGDSGAVDIWSARDWRRIGRISLDGITAGKNYAKSFAASLALSPDGMTLYVLDQGNWRVVAIDLKTRQRVSSASTGSNPFALALSPDGNHLYVTNSGLFEYSTVPGVEAGDIIGTGLRFPPFGYPSKQARSGVKAEGRVVPGLGSENDLRGSSLWTYDVSHPKNVQVVAKLRLGGRIRADAHGMFGGAAPSGLAADAQDVFVALAHDDAVAVVSPDGKTLRNQIALSPFHGAEFAEFKDRQGRPLRGVMPAAIALGRDRLYVAEAGINAVAVLDRATGSVLGHIPTGWYPAALRVSKDGRTLYVVNSKGKGAGPNGGAAFPSSAPGHYIGELQYGSLSIVSLEMTANALAAATATVVHDNEAALLPDRRLPLLKHVFLIVRENRTFDEILGDLPAVNGDASLGRYGMHGWAQEDSSLHDLHVTPNAHAIASRFAISDAFSTDSDVSADGHRWAVGVAPTPWMDVAWTSRYGGRRTDDFFGPAPGRRSLGGGADAPMPEDEPQFGTLWEHIAGSGLSLRNYGESLEVEGNHELFGTEPEGQRLVLNAPVLEPVFQSTDRAYPTINLGIPDQLRHQEFAKDFAALVSQGKAPSVTTIRLGNDHTGTPRPGDGYPYRASYVADNDLALGKIVETISHSAIWKDSAIFVTEDDAQGGVDHVDAHRSVLLVMSPWVRAGFVSHRYSSMPSIQKTMYELLGLGPLNLEDALATDLSDMFTDSPDLRPFTAEPSDPRIFDPNRARIARPKTAAEAHDLVDIDNARQIRADFHKKQTRKGLARKPAEDSSVETGPTSITR
jgi:YVTN family beta-propeller protein